MASTTSGCSSTFFNLRCTSVEPQMQRSTGQGSLACSKLDRVATWVGNGVATAFFASLERCSCINIATEDFDGDDDANEQPLICKDGRTGSRRRAGKGKKMGGPAHEDYMDDK